MLNKMLKWILKIFGGKKEKKLNKKPLCNHSVFYGYTYCPFCGEKHQDSRNLASIFQLEKTRCLTFHHQRKGEGENFCHDCGKPL